MKTLTKETLKVMANAIRILSIDAINKVNSGHPGLPLGAADIVTVLFSKFMKFDPNNPSWSDRDRFVLSAGHGSMLLYALSYLTGYKAMKLDDIKRFRRLGSKAPGHPELSLDTGVEATTGPLGQGFGMAVGMALAERMMNDRYGDDIVDHYTYALVGDGCLMEGISYEAASLAGHLGLNRLIVLFDDNGISIDGPVSITTSENQQARFEACGWDWQSVDGHDPEAIEKAILFAKSTNKPSIISCKTVIGLGLQSKQGKSAAHGQPPTNEELIKARQFYNWQEGSFEIPDDVLTLWRSISQKGHQEFVNWSNRFAKVDHKIQKSFNDAMMGKLPEGWQNLIQKNKEFFASETPNEPTRKSSKTILESLSSFIPEIIGGSADLTPSNLSKPDDFQGVSKGNYSGRYMHYGIREHAMAAITNGIALHKGFLPYCATFLCFSDYCRPAVRLSALMKTRVTYIFTHDSITQGPDGPTHQPIEHFVTMRATPNSLFIRPADGVETAECWEIILKTVDNPVALILTREAVPAVRKDASIENKCFKGAYVISEPSKDPKVTLIATGSEVSVALEAQKILESKSIGTKVVSAPCLELFNRQDIDYKQSILDKNTLLVSIEAATTMGWDRYIGPDGIMIGMNSFGDSGLPDELMQYFGITPQNIVDSVLTKMNGR
ncbi:transketolase [Gilliamella sp. wkB178]|uniref:transketolase n=1 Tax=Gilliamella sp. wkB178 TaxID=3120259 RepID=UPI00080E43BC|nr:transketolase [Gilliamella apicola]OCG07496.1 transketolase [Gilliamella apicola]